MRLKQSAEHNATREDLVLRFFAFLHCYKQFDHSVVDFLNTYMEDASKQFAFSENEQLFTKVFAALKDCLPRGIVRGSRNQTPVNLYEAVAVGAALAMKQSGKLVTTGVTKWISSSELEALTTGATNSRKMVSGRIEYCRDRFLGK